MEEKKVELTDEEIVKVLENCNDGLDDMNRHNCDTCPYRDIEPCGKAQMTDCLDLIHRLQDENKRLSLIAGMIDKGVAVEIVNMQETIDKQQAEIERLKQGQAESAMTAVEVLEENIELQKQVDELKEELDKAYETERANIRAEIADAGTSCHWCEQQTVKDTAKEILQKILTIIKKSDGFLAEEVVRIIAKQKGVEVE